MVKFGKVLWFISDVSYGLLISLLDLKFNVYLGG